MLASILSSFINPKVILKDFLESYYVTIETHQQETDKSSLIYRFSVVENEQSKDIEILNIMDNKVIATDFLKAIFTNFDFANLSLNALDSADKQDNKTLTLAKKGLEVFGINEHNIKDKASDMLGNGGLDIVLSPLIDFFEDLESQHEVNKLFLFLSLQKGKKVVSYAHKDEQGKLNIIKRETLDLFISKINI